MHSKQDSSKVQFRLNKRGYSLCLSQERFTKLYSFMKEFLESVVKLQNSETSAFAQLYIFKRWKLITKLPELRRRILQNFHGTSMRVAVSAEDFSSNLAVPRLYRHLRDVDASCNTELRE